MMKVFIVDDSAILRQRLVDILSELEEVEIVGQAEAPLEAINSIRKLNPDVVILDLRLSGGSGIDVLKNIKKDKPSPTVIVFTNYPYPQYRKMCMAAGADFFLDKSTEFDKLIEVFKQR